MNAAPTLGLVLPADEPPSLMIEAARAAEDNGLEEVWLWEDCFAASGVGAAAAILGATQSLRVGIGLMPVPLRVPSLTAMEIATLAAMFPGRFLPGLGHGVQEWMTQIGRRVDSPLTLLREHVSAIVALLRGEEVSVSGRYVELDRVQLRFPPAQSPPVFVGGRGPKTLELAGALADGVILDDAVSRTGRARPDRVAEAREIVAAARESAGREGAAEIVSFLSTGETATAAQVADESSVLFAAGVTRVAAMAGGGNRPPASGQQLLDFIPILAETRRESTP